MIGELQVGDLNRGESFTVAYEKLPVLGDSAVDPDTYIIPPDSMRDREELYRRLVYSYAALALKHPLWIGDNSSNAATRRALGRLTAAQLVEYCGHEIDYELLDRTRKKAPKFFDYELPYQWDDHMIRAFELLSQDYPKLCAWRGGEFGREGVDYTLMIDVATPYLYRGGPTIGEKRGNPTLVGISIRSIVAAYKKDQIWIGRQSDFKSPGITVRGEYAHVYEGHSNMSPILYRPPSEVNTQDLLAVWVTSFEFETEGATQLSRMTNKAFSKLAKASW